MQMPTRIDGAKEALEEQRLRRAIEDAERQTLGSGQSKWVDLDSHQEENRDEATDKGKAKKARKDGHHSGGRRGSTPNFLEWKEPVLR